jgi:streptogramin lyase
LVAATASGTTITVTMANKPDTVPGANAKIDFNYYKTTGTKTAFTIAKSDASSAVFQSYVKGTGGATYQLEVSLDGSHWVNLGSSQVHTGSNDHTLAQTIEPNWVYGRLNISVLGASTKIYALLSS